MTSYHSAEQNGMISRLFFKLLPVQIAIVAMGSINAIVDGIVAAHFIDATSVGVIGLYYTMIRILEATGAILLGGVSVLSGRYLGAGKLDKTRGICSLGFTAALIIGALLALVGILSPNTTADLLGANGRLKEALAIYVKGNAIGIVPQLLAQQMVISLQLERQDGRGQIGVIVMIGVNVALDFLFVAKLHMGVWGLALATSLANWAYCLVLGQYYFGGSAKLTPDPRVASWNEFPELLKTGFPNALTVFCLAARSLAVNRILLTFAGEDGLSAMSAFNMICGLVIAFAIGSGAVVRMLSSVFVGEDNREGLSALMRIVLTRVMPLALMVGAAVALLAPVLSGIFFPDRASHVYRLTRQLFTVYSVCVPFVLSIIAYTSYCQAIGRQRFVLVASALDGFFSFVIPSLLLAPLLSAFGVWLALPVGLVITQLFFFLYVRHCNGRWPRRAKEWLLLPADFGAEDRLVLILRSMEDVTQTAVRVQDFCVSHKLPEKTASHAGLCLEEISGNIVSHGFSADRKPHMIEVRVVLAQEGVLLRVKDDCIPFNPQEWHEITAPADPCTSIGIRLVYGLAQKVEYQNLLGLNVLSISLAY